MNIKHKTEITHITIDNHQNICTACMSPLSACLKLSSGVIERGSPTGSASM